jgi:hypothetical protein
VIDYRVSYDQGTSTWVTYADNIIGTSLTVTGLTVGITYSFSVAARSSWDYSAESDEV